MTANALTQDIASWLLALSVPGARRHLPSEALVHPDALLDALTRHGVASIALCHLGNFPELHALEPALRAAQASNVAWALTSVECIAGVSRSFAAAAVPWCVLKGVPLALRHYGDLAARRVGDIDILVAPLQVRAADRALHGLGWRRVGLGADEPLPPPRYWHEQRYAGPGGMTLELHHRLHPNPHLLAVPTAQLLDRTEGLDIGGVRVPVLDPVTELLYLSTHGSRHAWYRLLWVCDIAVIAAKAAPDFLDETHRVAVRLGLRHPLAQALLLAERLLATPAPAWAQALSGRSRRQRWLLTFAQESLWCARDALGNPTNRAGSSLLSALCQRVSMRFWAWELTLRARHEWRALAATP